MADEESLEARVKRLEMAVGVLFDQAEQERYAGRAVQTLLCAVIDDLRPEEPSDADEWFDRILDVAIQNTGLTADLASDAVIRSHGIDRDRLDALEDEREAVISILRVLCTALKNPKGGLVPD